MRRYPFSGAGPALFIHLPVTALRTRPSRGGGQGFFSELNLGDRILRDHPESSPTFDFGAVAPRVQIPSLENGESVLVFFPVTFRGSLSGLFLEDFGGGQFKEVEVTVGLIRRGRGSLAFEKFGDVISQAGEIGFGFIDTSPVPEPTTLLLLTAAGIAGGVRKWRLRARN
jgi:hypothetical protein